VNSEVYKTLSAKDAAFADLLEEIAKGLRRLADLMDRELNDG
jgi:hypothetical protein